MTKTAVLALAIRVLLSKCCLVAQPEHAKVSWVCNSLKAFSASLPSLASFCFLY